jgi:membrane-associated protein
MFAGAVTDWILSLSGAWAIAVVFLGPALESSAFIGLVIPGELAVLLRGCSPTTAASLCWSP